MTISVTCPCGKQLRAKPEHAGKRAKCPGCGQVLMIPAAETDLQEEAFRLFTSEDAPPRSEPARPTTEVKEPAAPETPADHYGFSDAPATTPPALAVPKKKKVKTSPAQTRAKPAPSGFSLRDRSYWLLLVALIPLGFSLFQDDQDDIQDRLQRSLEKISSEKSSLLDKEDVSLDDVLALLPDGRVEGAHLSRKSWVHWGYAFLSAGAFFGLILLMFPSGTANPHDLLLVGLFTATAGILLLFVVQFAAFWARSRIIVGRNIIALIYLLFWLIGLSYRSALNPDSNFFTSFLGFTFGVGLCEEICKAIPLLVHYRRSGGIGWRAACLWGLACGVGFGVSEGISYSADFYNGVQPGGICVVRFVSCVALHAIWSAAVAIAIYKNQAHLWGEPEWFPYLASVVRIVAVPMVLHGLYDTLLKKEMNGPALIVALVSFGWLVWQIEGTRAREGTEEDEALTAI